MILAVVAEKGGVGKTFVGTNMAGMRASLKRRVMLVDADRQGSAGYWARFREGTGLPMMEVQSLQGESLRRYISIPRVMYDDIIVDVGAGDSLNLEIALRYAHCALIPVRPTGVDMFTMQLMDRRVAQARQDNPEIRALALINQASPNPRHQALELARDSLERGGQNFSLAATVVRDRVAYQRAHLLGQTALEYSPRTPKAIDEMVSLYADIYGEDFPINGSSDVHVAEGAQV